MQKVERISIKISSAQYNYVKDYSFKNKLDLSKLLLDWSSNTVPAIVKSKDITQFDVPLFIRVTPEQKLLLQNKAKSYNLNLSGLIRHVIFTRMHSGKSTTVQTHAQELDSVEGLRILIDKHITDGNMFEAKQLISKWEQVAISIPVTDINWAYILAARGTIARFERNLEKSEVYLTQALKIAQLRKEKALISNICMQLGNLYGIQEKHELAIDYFEQAIDHLDPIDFPDYYIRTYLALCVQLAYLGNFAQIERFIPRLTRIPQFLEVKTRVHYLNRLGWLYTKIGSYTKAFDYLSQALTIALNESNDYELYYIYENLGIWHIQQMDFVNAEANLTRAKHYGNNQSGKSVSRINILGAFVNCALEQDFNKYKDLKQLVLQATKDGNSNTFKYLLFTAGYLFYPITGEYAAAKKGLEDLSLQATKLIKDSALTTLHNKKIGAF